MSKICKQLSAFFLMFVMAICITGCGSSQRNDVPEQTSQNSASAETNMEAEKTSDTAEQTSEPSGQKAEQESDTALSGGSDILVVYFSRTGEQYNVGVIDEGNTAIVADMIIDKTGADRFEILPEDDYYPYTYDELTDVAKQEQNENARPAYAGEIPDLSQYSTIFIGAPVWWGDWPMICYTFFENNEEGLAGKTLIPFSTHAGSGLSGFDRKLSSVCPNSTVGEGLAISGTDAQNNRESVRSTVNDWLNGLGY